MPITVWIGGFPVTALDDAHAAILLSQAGNFDTNAEPITTVFGSGFVTAPVSSVDVSDFGPPLLPTSPLSTIAPTLLGPATTFNSPLSFKPANIIPGGIAPGEIDPRTIPFNPNVGSSIGGSPMVFGGAIAVAPRLAIAIRAAASAVNAGRFAGVTQAGRGLLRRLLPILGVEQIADLFGFGIADIFGSSDIQQLEELVEELVDSGYIMWDARTSRDGQPVMMKYVVLPIDSEERPYGMAYRPFSRSTVTKMREKRNTIRRRSTPRRRSR